MNYKHIAMLLAATLPSLAIAQGSQSYQCTYGDLTRRIEILHETEASVPCEVHYYKDSEAPGERQVLWSATNEAGYCDAKTEEFIATLEGWGWDCEQADQQEAAPEPDDDTEALTSGDDKESSEAE